MNEVVYKGVSYNSVRNLCIKLNLNYPTVMARMNRDKMSLEEAIETPLTNTVTYKGINYANVKELCDKLGLNYTVINNRLSRDKLTLEEALEIPIQENRTEITYKGTTYPSLKDLSTKLNLNYKTIHRRMSNGLTLALAVESPTENHSIDYKGITYTNMRNLCDSLNLNYGTIVSRMNRDKMSLDQAIETPLTDNSVIYKGVTYLSIRDLCTKLNISYDLIRGRTSKGMSLEQAIETPTTDNSLVYKGNTYASIAEMAKAFDIPLSTLSMRLSQYNWSLEQAIETPVREVSKSITYKGITYNSKTELARAFNIPVETINSRLRSGLTLDQAIETPVTKANNFITPDSDIVKAAKALDITEQDKRIIFDTWASFNKRCFNQNDERYPRYGGRGITVFSDWVKNSENPDAFSKFLLWVLSPSGIGLRPKGHHLSGHTIYSINRINNDGNYEPGNLEWATSREQVENSTVITPVEVDGKKYPSIKEAAKELNMNYSTAVTRHNGPFGLTSEPVRTQNREEVMYLGVKYPNLRALCSKLNLNYTLVYERINYSKWSLKDAVEIKAGDYWAMRRRGLEEGNQFNSDRDKSKDTFASTANVAAAARALGVARSTISEKVYGRGMSVEEAVSSTKYIDKVMFNGKVYSTFKEACLDLGKSYSTGLKHTAKGYTTEQYLSGESSKIEKPTYEIDGMTFSNHRKMVRFYGYERGYNTAKEKGEVSDDTIVEWTERTREVIEVRGLKFVSRRVANKVKDFLDKFDGTGRHYQYLVVKNDSEIVAKLGVSFGGLTHLNFPMEVIERVGNGLKVLYDTEENVSEYFKVKTLKFSGNLFKFEYSEMISFDLDEDSSFCILLNSELVEEDK